MNRLRKFLALAPAGRALLVRNLMLLPVVAVLLRMAGFARTRAWLGRRAARRPHTAPTLAPREIARLVDAPAAFLGVGCLSRSLVLWHELGAHAIASEIRLGVARPCGGDVSAHAWVEFDGSPLNDAPDVAKRFVVLPEPIAGR